MQEQIQDQHLNGLAVQLGYAYYNRDILLELRKIKDDLDKDMPNHLQVLFGYMAETSRDNTIIHIAKLFDRKSRNKTRRLGKLINQIISSKSVTSNSYFAKQEWPKFLDRNKKIFEFFDADEPTFDLYLNWCLERLDELEKDDFSALNKVRNWRDKILAHNEVYDRSNTKLEDYEVDILLMFAEAVLDFTNSYVLIGSHVLVKKEQAGFIKHIFEEYL